MMMKKNHNIFNIVVLIWGISFLVFSFSTPAVAASKKLVLADVGWDSVQVHNRIAGFILKHGYGYEVEYMPGETIPLFAGLARGDIDINMEVWIANQREAYDKAIKAGQVVDLGSNFPDSWQGWLIPTYMIKGDPKRSIKPTAPDLKSVNDLPKYWKLFKDPEDPSKGRFYNSLPGWECTKINTKKLKVYGLDKYYNDFITGSDAALNGSMAAAFKKGEPWFGYYWAPTWPLGKYDMTPLEEPPFDQTVWDKNFGCEYPSVKVNIVVNTSLSEKAPDVVAFLKNYETTQAMANKFLAYMQEKKAKKKDAALWFLKNYRDLWHGWVPSDVMKKVEAAV
jgi:glycine betaine/proline transport system substrate-binding protein